eukprot:CAMPEP_0196586640 /NCGR_PEP_ID=MMETSP1081-20130531/55064_1 /TAXON_ID=36882 /ORGANISM="Pyramimonas amylifera, Strain CCMP720" /LENGTH=187 /DNA_ID=CAMNT_0041908591 /DNA_START=94 /DNA_END=654 /DNA_ORIENTATION=+
MTTRNLFDFYAKEAKRLGYLARSAFKLQQIQAKHKVIPVGGAVLDLGCSPGSWLQVACTALGPPSRGGFVLGLDLTNTPVPGKHCDLRVKTMQADVLQILPAELLELHASGFNTVLSDMAPKTCGLAKVDVEKSLRLAKAAYFLATGVDSPGLPREDVEVRGGDGGVLKEGGNFVVKILEGAGVRDW